MDNELIVNELDGESIYSMIYDIRGCKVMLDFDLAKIYGYTTSRFNEQVKRNIDKFDNDFMFQLNKTEWNDFLLSQIATANNNSKKRFLPYAFTEQGIYMLMTVLKGELATKQSKMLIRLFKQMKDYIVESNKLSSINELIKLVNKQNDLFARKEELEIIKKDLSILMDKFIDNKTNYLFLDGERIDAAVFYQDVFNRAKHSIYIVDDYIDIKTLLLLKSVNPIVRIIIFTDNKGTNNLNSTFINDFKKDTNINLIIKENKEFHDRIIVIDFNYKNEKIYHIGPSIKDSGNSGGGIDIVIDKEKYKTLITKMLLNNKDYNLL